MLTKLKQSINLLSYMIKICIYFELIIFICIGNVFHKTRLIIFLLVFFVVFLASCQHLYKIKIYLRHINCITILKGTDQMLGIKILPIKKN